LSIGWSGAADAGIAMLKEIIAAKDDPVRMYISLPPLVVPNDD
jgi:hypothetical protein